MIILFAYIKNNNHNNSNNNNSDNNNKKLKTLGTGKSKRTPNILTEIKYATLPTNN